jgi:hypothetical protein
VPKLPDRNTLWKLSEVLFVTALGCSWIGLYSVTSDLLGIMIPLPWALLSLCVAALLALVARALRRTAETSTKQQTATFTKKG